MLGRILFLVVWGVISLIFFLINPIWGAVVFFIGFLAVALVVSAMLGGSSRSSRSRDVNTHTRDNSSGQQRPGRRSDIQRGMDWHVPKVNRKGVEFITGASQLRKRQEDALKRVMKRLWE